MLHELYNKRLLAFHSYYFKKKLVKYGPKCSVNLVLLSFEDCFFSCTGIGSASE